MFIGHFAAGFAAKKAAPKTPLPFLIAGVQLVDLVWPLFLLLGWESVKIVPGITVVTPLDFVSYPITHSLLTSVVWAAAYGGAVYAFRRQLREALILGACVVSHWALDFLTHRPDLPLSPWSDVRVGLGMWNSFGATAVVEFGMFAAGLLIYRSVIRSMGKRVSLSFWLLAGCLAVFHVGNLFGPPPPSEKMIAIAGNALWLFVLWAWWSERHLRDDR